MFTTDCLYHIVELLKKTGPIALCQRWRPAGYLSCAAKLRQQVTRRDGLTDVVFRKRLSVWTNYTCAFLHAAARKQNVGSDHDVLRLHMFDNPIIGRVESVRYDFQSNPLFIGSSHPGIGNQCDMKTISACDAVHFLFDRARIGIYEDVQQLNILTITREFAQFKGS